MRARAGFHHALALLLLAACSGKQEIEIPTDRQVVLFPAGDTSKLSDGMIDSLAWPGDLVLLDSVLTLTDVRAHRFARIIPGRYGMLQGRRGQGPGEFNFPAFVDALGAMIAVGDQGNGRFQVFSERGILAASFNSPVPVHHFALESDTTVLVAIADSAKYLARVWFDGRWEPIASRPKSSNGESGKTARPNVRYDHLVAMLAGGRFAVFDQNDGRLREYDSSGALIREHRLPEDLIKNMKLVRDEQLAVLGKRFGSVLTAPIAKDMAGDRRGHLLLLISAGKVGGLWLDLNRNRAISLEVGREGKGDPLWSATSGSVSGDSVAIASFDGTVRLKRVPAAR
jgi:hypothetical protein